MAGGAGMNITFDVNLWTLLAFMLNVYAIRAAQSRASAEDLDKKVSGLRKEIAEVREKQSGTNVRLGERLQAVETQQHNAISDADIAAVHKRADKLQQDLMTELSSIGRTVARLEGIMEGWTSNNLKERKPQ
jgi:predicted  nucleic acid-binding Zn-ribbon protein